MQLASYFGYVFGISNSLKVHEMYPNFYQQNEQITCYECSYTSFSNGETIGNTNCIELDDTTTTVTIDKYATINDRQLRLVSKMDY